MTWLAAETPMPNGYVCFLLVSLRVGFVLGFLGARKARPKRLVYDSVHLKAWTRSYESVEVTVHSEFLTKEPDNGKAYGRFRDFARAWKEVVSSVVLRFVLRYDFAGELMNPDVYRLLELEFDTVPTHDYERYRISVSKILPEKYPGKFSWFDFLVGIIQTLGKAACRVIETVVEVAPKILVILDKSSHSPAIQKVIGTLNKKKQMVAAVEDWEAANTDASEVVKKNVHAIKASILTDEPDD